MLTLLGIMLLAKALSYRLSMYDRLYSPRGVATGASYADVHAESRIMRLPGEAREQEEFVLMLPFTPQWQKVRSSG